MKSFVLGSAILLGFVPAVLARNVDPEIRVTVDPSQQSKTESPGCSNESIQVTTNDWDGGFHIVITPTAASFVAQPLAENLARRLCVVDVEIALPRAGSCYSVESIDYSANLSLLAGSNWSTSSQILQLSWMPQVNSWLYNGGTHVLLTEASGVSGTYFGPVQNKLAPQGVISSCQKLEHYRVSFGMGISTQGTVYSTAAINQFAINFRSYQRFVSGPVRTFP